MPEAAQSLTLSPLSQQSHFSASATRNWVFCCLQPKVFTQILLILLEFCHESTLVLLTASYTIFLLSQKTGCSLASSSLPSSAIPHQLSAWPHLEALWGLTQQCQMLLHTSLACWELGKARGELSRLPVTSSFSHTSLPS